MSNIIINFTNGDEITIRIGWRTHYYIKDTYLEVIEYDDHNSVKYDDYYPFCSIVSIRING